MTGVTFQHDDMTSHIFCKVVIDPDTGYPADWITSDWIEFRNKIDRYLESLEKEDREKKK